ncbi:hypothetical protein TorRG33x02_114790, partial [Trema orientale]
DFPDFANYSKEDEIQSLIKDIVTDTYVATEPESIARSDNHATTLDPNVTTSLEQTCSFEQTVDIQDPIQKEPSSRVKKNHPTDLIIGNLDDGMVTRRRNINLV